MEFVWHLLTLVGVYATLATALDLLVGRAGQVSLAGGLYFGIGAYSSALLARPTDGGAAVGLAVGVGLAAAAALAMAAAAARVRREQVVVVTFAFQVVGSAVMANWVGLTGGPAGVANVPTPRLFGAALDTPAKFAAVAGVAAGLAVAVAARVAGSRYGLVLGAIRDSEPFAAAVGKRVAAAKLGVHAVAAGLSALAGSVYAHYVTFVEPGSFGVLESTLVLAMVVIGGPGRVWGPAAGAAVLVLLPEALRVVGLPGRVAAPVRQVVYGAAVAALAVYRPQGLFGRYRPG